ncbi:MAG: Bug family tripartite tricarboxylate transporter substrate binding protein [Burkholderiales bacterium]
MKNSRLISAAAAVLAACFNTATVAADMAKDYPTRPIRLIMPNAPGSSADTIGRIVAARLGEVLGQQIVVDNRAGAGGSLGLEIGKSANPDGYTLITTSISALTVAPHIRKGLGYDPMKDFEYVAMYSRQGAVLVVHPGLPVKSVKELIEYAKARQGKLNMASAGTGSTSHFSGSALMITGGFTSLHVPYKGGGPSVAAVAAGESHWTMPPSAAVMTLVRAGRLRALGHSLPQRTPLLPDIPAIAESLPGFKHIAFSGLLAPRGLPKTILDKLHANVDRTVNSPETREQFAVQGVEPATSSPEEFRRAIRDELVEIGKLVKAIGLKDE